MPGKADAQLRGIGHRIVWSSLATTIEVERGDDVVTLVRETWDVSGDRLLLYLLFAARFRRDRQES